MRDADDLIAALKRRARGQTGDGAHHPRRASQTLTVTVGQKP
jgi:hypothetical protein